MPLLVLEAQAESEGQWRQYAPTAQQISAFMWLENEQMLGALQLFRGCDEVLPNEVGIFFPRTADHLAHDVFYHSARNDEYTGVRGAIVQEYPMAYYRLYLRTGSRGRFSSFDDFEAQCDASAIDHVASLNRNGAMELWCGSRLVERWEHAPMYADEGVTD